MKWMGCFLWFFFAVAIVQGQRVVYSSPVNDENAEINFEIVGKVGNRYVVYKQVRSRHYVSLYDEDMKLINNEQLNVIPDKTFNVDVVASPDYFFLIYQYNRNRQVFCKAIKVNANGSQVGEPMLLDDSRISAFSEKKIYSVSVSEDKQKILVYKALRKGNKLTLIAKVFNPLIELTDSAQILLTYNEKRDSYGELTITNKGLIVFPYTEKHTARDNFFLLNTLVRFPQSDSVAKINIPLQNNYIDEVSVKYDNLNNRALLNSLYTDKVRGNILGLFAAIVSPGNPDDARVVFNLFPDSVRNKMSMEGYIQSAFNDIYLRNAVLKLDGGVILNLEDFSTRTSGSPYRNRFDYLYGSPYSSPYGGFNDYYLYSPSYYGYYRPYYSNRYYNSHTEYYYNNILVISLDKDLKPEWNTMLFKKQVAVDTDNFLSFGSVVMGGALHYLFMESDRSSSILNDNAVFPNGETKRFPTVKGSANAYNYMPKLMKQVSSNTVIIPCIYRGNIIFAKIDFER